MKRFGIPIVLLAFVGCAGKTPKPAVSLKEYNKLKEEVNILIRQVAQQESDGVRTQDRLRNLAKGLIQAFKNDVWFNFLLKGASVHTNRIYRNQNAINELIVKLHPPKAEKKKRKKRRK